MDQGFPLERLRAFQARVGLAEAEFTALRPHREVFIRRREEYGRFFHDYFLGIPQTRLILEHEREGTSLREVLGDWFGRLFAEELGEPFLRYLWHSGMVHVDLNLDQRYVNLGYVITRAYCRDLLDAEVPGPARPAVGRVVDRLLDFCVLVATDSFISGTSRCNQEVIAGIAHQVRNPVTVIGGNLSRLRHKLPPDDPARTAFEAMLGENRRLERMVEDIVTYSELFRRDFVFREADLDQALRQARTELAAAWPPGSYRLAGGFAPDHRRVLADYPSLVIMFRHLLENALEARDPADPELVVQSHPAGQANFLEMELLNSGRVPEPAQLEELFSPFHSTKPLGTGFGLPIAELVARRNLGALWLLPAPGKGVRVVVQLPRAGTTPSRTGPVPQASEEA